MTKRAYLLLLVPAVAYVCVASAQFPIMNMIADKVIQKYQTSTCEQLWQNKGKQNPEEQGVMGFLQNDPQMRQEFFNKIAGPVINKMFECGMIP